MDDRLLEQGRQFSEKRRKRRIWKNIVSVLACVVVFCTTYALILPAITMEKDTYCGHKEHKHSEKCYEAELICTLSEEETSTHEHSEECYQKQEAVICGKEETQGHTHSADCEKTEKERTCGLEELEGHAHTDTCYAEDGTLSCGKEERAGHAHSDTCYTVKTIMACGKEEYEGHTHSDTCYETKKVLTCEKEAGVEEKHIHSETCYKEKLACNTKEHTHEKICYSDKTADVETASDWEKTLPDELTGVWADDVLAVAESQLKYAESTKNFIVTADDEVKGYSRYGAWYGDPYGHWCAMFVSFCLDYAEVDKDLMPQDANCQNWIETLSKEEYDLYHKAGNYEPVPGDLIFFNFDEDKDSDHVGFVVEVTEATGNQKAQVKTIEGNSIDNNVRYLTYDLNDDSIMGYGQLPEKPEEKLEEVMTEAEPQEEPERKIAMFATRSDSYAPDVDLTGDLNEDMLTIAESQIGKNSSTGNYGAWYTATFGGYTSDWTAQFVNYCLYYAGITSGIPSYTSGDMSTWINALKQSDLYYEKGNGTPSPGDLVIGYPSYSGDPVTVGIVKSLQQNGNAVNAIVAFSDGVRETGEIWNRAEGFISLPKGELTAEIPNVLTAKATYQAGAVPEGTKLVIEFFGQGEDTAKDALVKREVREDEQGVRAIYYVNAYFSLNGEKINVPGAEISIDFNPDLDPNEVHPENGKPHQPQAWKYYKITNETTLNSWTPKNVSVEPYWSHEVQDITFHYENVNTFVICSAQNVYAEKTIVTDFGSVMLKGYSSSVYMSADLVANLVTDEALTSVWDAQLKEKYETEENAGAKIKNAYYLELYFTEGGERIEPKSGENVEIEISFAPALDSKAITYEDAGAPTWYVNNLSDGSVNDLENAVNLGINSNHKITNVTLQYEKADVFSFTSMQDTYTFLEADVQDGNTQISINAIGKVDALPEGSQMVVEFVDNEAVETALKAQHESTEYKLPNIQLFTIKFFDAEGNEFVPEPNQVSIKLTAEPAFSAAFEGDVLTIGEWVMNYASEENGTITINEPVEENKVELNVTDDFELTQASFLYSENDYFALSAKMSDPNHKKEVTVVSYKELEEAIANAGSEKLIVTLDSNFEAEGTIEIPNGKNIVIELAGRTITTSDSPLFNVTGGRLTIQDREATTERVETSSGKLYGNDASYEDGTLTYYVTVPTVTNATMGETVEHLEKHTVNIKGEITGGSVPAIVIDSGTVNLNSGAITNYSNRAIVQKSGTLNLKGGYICGNTAETVEVIDGVTGWDNEISGGAIYVTGDSKLNISGSVLAANSTSERGGAIVVESLNNPVVKMTGGVLSGNMSTSLVTDSGHGWHFGGGGISLDGNASMLMTGGYITNNKVCSEGYFDGGGGIFLAGSSTLTLVDGNVTGNYAAGGGGGIRADFMGEAYTNTIISGGFISSNHAQTAEGGGVSIGWDGVAYVTGGFVTNNSTATVQHWGGGGLFVSNGGKLYIKNALVTENTAGGFGGGVAGCSTGRVFLISDRGSAIWGNNAAGTTVTDGSEKAEDKIYGLYNPVFMENGFDDYFCALTSTVEGNMVGGGASNWKGSADEVPVTIGKDQSCTASYVMGLTAYPNDADKATALAIIKSSNGVYINGNDSNTHGGGVLCNGYLVFGQPGEIDFSTGLEVHGTKQLLNGTETEIPLVDADGNPVTFQFYIVDANTNTVISTGKNKEDGSISFSARIPFAKAGTFTYYVYEDQDYNSDGFVMDTSKYRITVDVDAERSYLNNAGEDTIIKTQFVIKHITVEKNSGNGKWTTIKSENVSWANEYEYAPVVLPLTDSATFKNYSLESTKVAVEKKWAGDVPEHVPQITVGLYRISKVKGEEPSEPELYGEKIILSEENNWSYTWDDELPLLSDDGNTTYEYKVIEDELTGYVPSYEVHNNTEYDDRIDQYINVTTYVITNTKTEELKYTVDVTKISDEKSPNGQDIPLGNAEFEFTVKNSDSDEETVLYFLKESDGSYVLCDAATEGATTTLITNFRGKLVLKELPAGTYVLEETKAPTGYMIAEEKVFILGEESESTTITYKMVDAKEVLNYELPETGGPGTNVYTAGGILLLMISVLLYIKRKNQMKGGRMSN